MSLARLCHPAGPGPRPSLDKFSGLAKDRLTPTKDRPVSLVDGMVTSHNLPVM